MNQQHPVPCLDLAPKLKRPLSLWNPLDYLRLLYWVFFFPQAYKVLEDLFDFPLSFFVLNNLRDILLSNFKTDPRTNNPSRVAAAGFWYLHEKKPANAMSAFASVRSLLYGEEMYTLFSKGDGVILMGCGVKRLMEPADNKIY